MTTILCKRTLSGLAPDDDAAREALKKVPVGNVVSIEIRRARSHKRLRRWWALMNLIASNSDTIRSAEQAHDLVKILAGHCSHIVSKSTGEVYQVANSIAFSKMDETEFETFWARAVKAVTEHILPDITDADIEREVLNLIGAGNWQT